MDSQGSDADGIGVYPVHARWTNVDEADPSSTASHSAALAAGAAGAFTLPLANIASISAAP